MATTICNIRYGIQTKVIVILEQLFNKIYLKGHKNTKLFINHGGLLGCLEALYHGIPTISVPIFSEQFRNVASMVAKNMTIKLDLNNVTTASLDEALNEVLQNPIYR